MKDHEINKSQHLAFLTEANKKRSAQQFKLYGTYNSKIKQATIGFMYDADWTNYEKINVNEKLCKKEQTNLIDKIFMENIKHSENINKLFTKKGYYKDNCYYINKITKTKKEYVFHIRFNFSGDKKTNKVIKVNKDNVYSTLEHGLIDEICCSINKFPIIVEILEKLGFSNNLINNIKQHYEQ